MVTLVVDADTHWVVKLWNAVSFIHAKVVPREEFEQDYKPVRLVDDGVRMVLHQFRGYARTVGMTPEAAVYLTKLTEMPPADVQVAITQGLETKAKIQKEAQKMASEEQNSLPSGKAPRKLAGAALKAVQRKEERLAAEAKSLASAVTDDKVEEEKADVVDARLPSTPVKRSSKKGETPKLTKDTPSADQAKKIIKGKANRNAQVDPTGQFDASKLKDAQGNWRSASAMFKGLLFEGKKTDDQIATAVDKQFGLGEQKAKDYVKWNRGWFRRQGVELPASK